jgi:hypothetical protein
MPEDSELITVGSTSPIADYAGHTHPAATAITQVTQIDNGELENDLDANNQDINDLGGLQLHAPAYDSALPTDQVYRDGHGFLRVKDAYAPDASVVYGAEFGCKGDGRYITGTVTSGTNLAVTSGTLTSADVGKLIVLNPGASTHQVTTIATVTNSTHATLSATVTNFSTKRCVIGTNNSSHFLAAITEAYDRAGAVIELDGGIYLSGGEFDAEMNAVLVIPDSTYNGLPIIFRGPIPAPSLYNDYATDTALAWRGVVIYVAAEGSGDDPAWMRPYRSAAQILSGNLTHTSVIIENILLRSPVNRSLSICDFQWGGGLEFKGSSVDTDFDAFNTLPLPTRDHIAIAFPQSGNSSWCRMSRGCVVGYYKAIAGSEHVVLDSVNIFNNFAGIFLGDGTGITAAGKVHLLNNIRQIMVDPDASAPVLNGWFEFESPTAGVGGNANFEPKYIIHYSRVDPAPPKYLAGTIFGHISVPGGTLDTTPSGATESFRTNFTGPLLTCFLVGVSQSESIIKMRGITYEGDADSQAALAIGDPDISGGAMPFTTVGIKMGHDTNNTGLFLTKGTGAGVVIMYVPGQNKCYFSSIGGGAFDTAQVIVLQKLGRVVIGDPATADDSVSNLCVGGKLAIVAADGGGVLRLGDATFVKVVGMPIVESAAGFKIGGDMEMTVVGNGVIQKSADGVRHKIVINNDGTLTTALA